MERSRDFRAGAWRSSTEPRREGGLSMLVRGVRARSVTSSSYRGTPHPVSSMSGGRERTREAKGEPDGAQVSNRPSASAWMKPDDGHADCRHSRIGIRHAGIKRAWTTDETPTEPGSRSRRVSVRRARERRCARSRSRLARRAWGATSAPVASRVASEVEDDSEHLRDIFSRERGRQKRIPRGARFDVATRRTAVTEFRRGLAHFGERTEERRETRGRWAVRRVRRAVQSARGCSERRDVHVGSNFPGNLADVR